MLQREADKKWDTKQVQQAMTEDTTVYEFDEVYDWIEEWRKKAVTAELGTDKNKLKFITSQKEAAEQGQRGYETVIERKAHSEIAEEDESDDKEAFVASSYHKKIAELEADELWLRKEEEYDENMEFLDRRISISVQISLSIWPTMSMVVTAHSMKTNNTQY